VRWGKRTLLGGSAGASARALEGFADMFAVSQLKSVRPLRGGGVSLGCDLKMQFWAFSTRTKFGRDHIVPWVMGARGWLGSAVRGLQSLSQQLAAPRSSSATRRKMTSQAPRTRAVIFVSTLRGISEGRIALVRSHAKTSSRDGQN